MNSKYSVVKASASSRMYKQLCQSVEIPDAFYYNLPAVQAEFSYVTNTKFLK